MKISRKAIFLTEAPDFYLTLFPWTDTRLEATYLSTHYSPSHLKAVSEERKGGYLMMFETVLYKSLVARNARKPLLQVSNQEEV